MKRPLPVILLLLFFQPLAAGDLPSLAQQPWLGDYAGYERRGFHFSLTTRGEGLLRPMGDKKELISNRYSIKFLPLIEEVLPDGTVAAKTPLKDGWEAVTPATIDPEKVTYRGTSKGDAKFEVVWEFDGDEIRAGGKVIDPGTLKNPRFVLRVQVPNVYYYEKDDEKLKEKAKRDRIDLVRGDGKKLKLDSLTPLDAESAEFNGPGIGSARIDLSGYKGHRFELGAGPNALFQFWNKGEDALYEGFTLGWTPDPAKDPAGAARFVIEVR